MNYIAHNRGETDTENQLLLEHLKNVSELSDKFAECLNLSDYAEIIGMLHDIGKYSSRFQVRINGNEKIKVDHSTCGAQEAYKMKLPIRRNEVKSKLLSSKAKTAMSGKNVELFIDTGSDIQQRAATVLKNVHYVIEAHFDMTDKANQSDNPGKFQEMMKRRLDKGQCFHQPYLGCREFPAKFRRWEFDTVPTVDISTDLGLMLYDMDYSDKNNITPMYFRAKIQNGVLDLTDCEVLK